MEFALAMLGANPAPDRPGNLERFSFQPKSDVSDFGHLLAGELA
jgi:hypothetical protein